MARASYRTKAREAITAFLKANVERRFTAREIYEQIRDAQPGVNRATIYRNLEKLCEEGELLCYREANCDAWYYQYSGGSSHCNAHMHAQCSECGRIFHLEMPFVDRFEQEIKKNYGIDIDSAQTIIIGKCKECEK